MPSLFHISGPALILVDGLELGFCERSPEIQFEVEYEGTLNATSGTRFGGVYTYQGAEADIDMLLTRFDVGTLAGKIYPLLAIGGSYAMGTPNANAPSSPPVSPPASVPVEIVYTTTGSKLTFGQCLVRAVRVFDIGPIPRKVYIKFRAVRNGNNVLGAAMGSP